MGMIECVNVVIPITDISIHMKTCCQWDVNIVIVMSSWKRKMKNPCNECLIKSACTDVCDKKTRYGIIMNGKVRRYREYVRDERTQGMTKRLEYYEDQFTKHSRQIGVIIKRATGRL